MWPVWLRKVSVLFMLPQIFFTLWVSYTILDLWRWLDSRLCYQDCGGGEFVGADIGNSWCDPFKTWQKVCI
jgi:hypothetical protein